MAIGRTNTGGGSGSGGGIGFSVIGSTTVPSSTKENTIWVDTDMAITDWHVSAEEPDAVNGTVWIQTGTSSPVAFNALKKHCIMVYPDSVKIHNGTTFNFADASIYQNGKWKQFSTAWDGVLFDAGNQYESITGGWTNASGNTLTASVYSNQTFGNPVHTVKMIDLTDFKTLYVTYTGVTKVAHFGVTKTRDLTLASQYAAIKTASVGTVSLDVSGLTGEHYVTLVAGAATNEVCAFTATKVWLE